MRSTSLTAFTGHYIRLYLSENTHCLLPARSVVELFSLLQFTTFTDYRCTLVLVISKLVTFCLHSFLALC